MRVYEYDGYHIQIMFSTCCIIEAMLGGSSPLRMRITSSAYPIAQAPSLGKVDSRELNTRFHTSGDRIPPCGEPMVGIIIFFASCKSTDTSRPVSTILYQPTSDGSRQALLTKRFLRRGEFYSFESPRAVEADDE